MNSSDIDAMVRALKPALKDRFKAKAILERYWTTRIALVWTLEDIHKAGNERGAALTRKEAQHLLDDLKRRYNRQLGIKWIDLWDLIDGSGMGRKMTKQELKAFLETDAVAICRGARFLKTGSCLSR